MKPKKTSLKVNFLYNSAYQLFAILIPLITTPYLTRTIGTFGIGEYGYAYSIAFYFTIFIKLGLNNYGTREIASIKKDKDTISKKFWEIYTSQAILCVLFFSLYLIYSLFISNNQNISLLFCLMVLSAGIDITWLFWGLEDFKLTARRDFIIKIITTICIFLFVKNETDTWKYCALISTGLLLSQIILLFSARKIIKWKKPNTKSVIKHIKPNLILFIPIIAISLYKTMDKIMLGVMSSKDEVGYYQSSENVIQVPIALITSLGTIMQPRISNMIFNNANKQRIDAISTKSMILAMFLSTSLGFGIMTIAKEFVPIFYGDGFEKCILLFYILLPSCIFMAFANVIRTQYLIPNKKDKEYIISLLLGAVVNLIINLLLIPKMQSVGATIGTLIAESTVCISQTILIRRREMTKRFVSMSLPFIISGLLMFIVWHKSSLASFGGILELLFKIIAAACTYSLLLIILLLIWKYIFKINIIQILKEKEIKAKQSR